MSEAAAGGGAPATGGDSAQLGGSIAVTPEAAPAPATGGEPSPPSSPNLGNDSGLIGSQPMQQETDSAAPIEQNNGLICGQNVLLLSKNFIEHVKSKEFVVQQSS